MCEHLTRSSAKKQAHARTHFAPLPGGQCVIIIIFADYLLHETGDGQARNKRLATQAINVYRGQINIAFFRHRFGNTVQVLT